jgi:iron complex outermembrane receptor protein
MPDLLSSVNSIQIQRGVGASSNGAGAFGASINMQTNTLNEKPYAELINSGGSFNTLRNTLNLGSGLIGGKFAVDARLSKIGSDGYIDRAKSTLSSYYLSGGYYGNKTVVKAIMFSGTEKTYQAWYYVPEDSIKNGNRTYNPAGEYYDANGNVKYYDNETDNYKQDNYQLHWIQTINNKLNFSIAGHYTEGKGYYEQYRAGDDLANYEIEDVVVGSSTITTSDLIRRRWLDNDFVGVVYSLNYSPSTKLKINLGGGNNNYFGRHNGEVIWARYASNSDIGKRYYSNNAFKNDNNVYFKSTVTLAKGLSAFLDVQYRNVYYSFLGFDSTLSSAQQSVNYDFFNPKFGINYNVNDKIRVYISYAMANKEPNRDDFVNSSNKSRPKYESLNDLELGASYASKDVFAEINLYNMDYTNQLVLNGQVNDVGAYNRVNVKKSFRRGIEIQAGYNITKYFTLNGNLTLSQNKIDEYTEYVDSANADWSVYTQYKINYKNTDISFSPNVIAGGILTAKPIKGLEISFINKYVGRQYLDNTGNIARSINPYYVADARINYSIKTKWHTEIGLNLTVHNLLSTKYETNGYTFSYYTDTTLNTFNYLAPAAPINFLAGIQLKFQ